MEETKRTLKTIDKTMEILDLLREKDGMSLTELAEELDMVPSTLYRYLVTLEENEYVVKEDGDYYPSLKFVDMSKYVQSRKQIYEVADKYTTRVSEETSCRSVFLTEEHGRGVYVAKNFGEYTNWEHAYVGHRCYLHNRAGGKAILAFLAQETVEEIIHKHGLPASTKNTITDPENLFEELEQIRAQGYSLNREEQIEGIRAVGVPIVPEDEVVGAITAGGSVTRLRGDWFKEELPQTLSGIAKELELDLTLS